jgi:peptidase E
MPHTGVSFCVGPTPLFHFTLSIAQFLNHHKILFPIFTIHSLRPRSAAYQKCRAGNSGAAKATLFD